MMVELAKLFPRHPRITWAETEVGEEMTPFTIEKLQKAAKRSKLVKFRELTVLHLK